MLREQQLLFNRLLGLCDLFILILAMVFANLLINRSVADVRQHILVVAMAVPIWYYLLSRYQLYAGGRRRGVYDLLTRLLSVHVFGGAVLAGLLFVLHLSDIRRSLLISFIFLSYLMFTSSRILAREFISVFSKSKDLSRNIIIVGAKDKAQKFYRLIEEHARWGINVLGFVQVDTESPQEKKIWGKTLGDIDHLIEICKQYPVDEVVFCPPGNFSIDVESYVAELEELGITVHMALNFYEIPHTRRVLSLFHNEIPILTYYSKAFDSRQLFLKRVLDICGALIGLGITLVLLPGIVIAIKKDSPGPLLFGQERVGLNGRRFKCWKFRSMYIDAEERKKELMAQNEMSGAIFKMKKDPRITKIGAFMRKTSLDELPQFWNVLMGDMSLVGTRPPTPDEVAQYENWHRRRISIKPGITGNWQISGRNKIEDFDDIVNLDLQYIDNWSFWLDIKILIKTVMVVFAREGSY